MPKVTIIDNIKVLIDIISSSIFFLIILLVMVLLAYLFITTTKKSQNQMKETYFLILIIGALILFLQYGSSIGKIFDYFMNNVFILIYFPNLAIYFLALIISNIIMWKSIFKGPVNMPIRIINSISYFLIHYFLILILSLISEHKLDIFSQASIYQNKEVLSLIELSSIIFVVWILFLLGFHFVSKYLLKKEQTIKSDIVTLPQKEEIIRNEKNKEDIKEITLNEPFTLEEYRLLSKMLKEEKQKKREAEQAKLTELQQLLDSLK